MSVHTTVESGGSGAYAVVHLVAQEARKHLVGPQVVDHMASQAAHPGADRPAVLVVGALEAARDVVGKAIRNRIRELATRDPRVRVVLLPYSSRLGRRVSTWSHARRLRREVGDLPVVFHCRGQAAVEWGIEVARRFERAGIVADVRGAWPEELLFQAGYDGPEGADSGALRSYHLALAQLHHGLAYSGAVISVSRGMLQWLATLGVDRQRLVYVPCCVSELTYSPDARTRVRRALGLDEKVVLTYLGTLTRYQHVEDGVVRFFRAAADACRDVHLLGITDVPDTLRLILSRADVPPDRVTVVSVPQHEVARYLSAGDAGLLLRGPSRLNQYSQPTKLGEYLAAGLPVVVARGTGAVDSMIEREGAGIVLECFEVSDDVLAREAARVCRSLRDCGGLMRERALALCEREFVWSKYTVAVRAAYRRALAWQAASVRER